jgi:hypothetical protein
MTAPIGPISRREPAIETTDFVKKGLLDAGTVTADGRLHRPSFRIRRASHDQQAATRLHRTGHECIHCTEAEVRVNRERVDFHRRTRTEIGLGVRLVRRAHIPALGIKDRQQSCSANVFDQPRQGTHASPPVTFVKRRLWFHQSHRADSRLDGDVDEPIEAIGRITQVPTIQHVTCRIETPYQRPEGLPHQREATRKRVRHTPSFARAQTLGANTGKTA